MARTEVITAAGAEIVGETKLTPARLEESAELENGKEGEEDCGSGPGENELPRAQLYRIDAPAGV